MWLRRSHRRYPPRQNGESPRPACPERPTQPHCRRRLLRDPRPTSACILFFLFSFFLIGAGTATGVGRGGEGGAQPRSGEELVGDGAHDVDLLCLGAHDVALLRVLGQTLERRHRAGCGARRPQLILTHARGNMGGIHNKRRRPRTQQTHNTCRTRAGQAAGLAWPGGKRNTTLAGSASCELCIADFAASADDHRKGDGQTYFRWQWPPPSPSR